MKKYMLMPLLALTALSANAQDFDSKPTITIDNKAEDLHFTVGAVSWLTLPTIIQTSLLCRVEQPSPMHVSVPR